MQPRDHRFVVAQHAADMECRHPGDDLASGYASWKVGGLFRPSLTCISCMSV